MLPTGVSGFHFAGLLLFVTTVVLIAMEHRLAPRISQI